MRHWRQVVLQVARVLGEKLERRRQRILDRHPVPEDKCSHGSRHARSIRPRRGRTKTAAGRSFAVSFADRLCSLLKSRLPLTMGKSAEPSDLDAPESRGRVREPYGFMFR